MERGAWGIGSSIVSRAVPARTVTNFTWKRDKSKELAAGSSGSVQGGYTVYNLTVENDHTFFVGTTGGGTSVHNVDCVINPETRKSIADILRRINRGDNHPYPTDGITFHNRPLPGKTIPELPLQPSGYYQEYTVPTPGIVGRGRQRLVTGNGGEIYYTPDHYTTFLPLK